jgi:DUF4097 and DUF4098 domain-containing protein YvlB
MASVPPPYPPPGYDPRAYRQAARDQARAVRDQVRAQRDAYKAQAYQWKFQMRGARRGSVLGPLLLILTGLVFLLLETGRLSHDAFWGWYGRWWPFLLVAAGVILLLEWGLDQFWLRDPEHPRYRRSVGGGVVLLIILLCVSGPVARSIHGEGQDFFGGGPWFGSGFNSGDLNDFFGDKHESDQTLDHTFESGESLTIDNPRGDVTVRGTSDDGQIHIAVHKQVYANSDSSAESLEGRLAPNLTQSGDTLRVAMPSVARSQADLVITVPAGAFMTINANRGDIHLSGIKAAVTVTANHGDIELSAITGGVTAHINSYQGSISVHSVSGPVSVEGRGDDATLSDITGMVSVRGEFTGSTHLEHVAAPVRVHSNRTDLQMERLDGVVELSSDNIYAEQALGPVVLTTHDRNVHLERVAGDLTVTDRNGTVDLTAAPPLGNVSIEDRNGSVKMVVPEKAGFSVQANTSDGEISTDFPLTTQGDDRKRTLIGHVGAGGSAVRITTAHGDISLNKGVVEGLPAVAPAPPKITLVPPTPPTPPKVPGKAPRPVPPPAPSKIE